jgi:hypothetical protein
VPAFVHEAELMLVDRADLEGPGTAVTAALGGAWPHHNAITRRGGGYLLRTVFVAPESEEALVREKIVSALGDANEWEVVTTASRTLAHDEVVLADRLRPETNPPR